MTFKEGAVILAAAIKRVRFEHPYLDASDEVLADAILAALPADVTLYSQPAGSNPSITFSPDYGPVERLSGVRPSPDHPIWRLDVATLDYVIESLVGIWSAEPDLLIDSAIADVRVIRGYAASRPNIEVPASKDAGQSK